MGALFLIAALALAGMPPLSGFVGKLLILDAWQDHMLQVWAAVLVTSFLMILGFARAGSLLWKPTEAAPPIRPEPVALLPGALRPSGRIGRADRAGRADPRLAACRR